MELIIKNKRFPSFAPTSYFFLLSQNTFIVVELPSKIVFFLAKKMERLPFFYQAVDYSMRPMAMTDGENM